MNAEIPPAAGWAPNKQDSLSYGRDSTVASLEVWTSDGHSYLLPYAQFLYAETTPNPALETERETPPQRLVICFAVAEVTGLGRGLEAIEQVIQKNEASFVRRVPRRYDLGQRTHVFFVTIAFAKDTP